MGIFPFEDSQNYSPYIHTSNDLVGLSLNSAEMAMYFIKAMVANVATMANYLAPPQNLLAIPGDETVQLSWEEVYDIDHYNVYKDGGITPVASPTDPTYVDEDVENFNTYSYYVTCIYSETGEESNPSNMVTVTPLPPMAFPYFDDFEEGGLYWNYESPWGITAVQYHSSTHSMTESPSGSYGNNIEASATLYGFSLENAESASLSFWTRYSLETNYDYTWLELSTNGTTWIELDEFNGNQMTWTEKEYSLDDWLGEPYVLIRFRFYSDTWVTADGMYIDDLLIDAETTVSEISSPFFSPENITIQPNPFMGSTNVSILLNEENRLILDLRDATGKSVLSMNRQGKKGLNTFTLDARALKEGIYYLVIGTGTETLTRKIILLD
jgi:hypothetical protein